MLRAPHIGKKIISVMAMCTLQILAFAGPATHNDDPIVMGMSAPMSGPNGSYGREMREGVDAYFAKVNESGGVHGHLLKLVAKDDGYEVDRAVANAKELITNDHAFALMAFYGSASTAAVLPLLDTYGIPLIGTISGAEILRDPPNPHIFHLRASYGDETAAIVKSLLTVGLKRIAVLYQDDAFGQAGLKGVKAALSQAQLELVAVASVPRNSVALNPAVAEISKAKPQAIVLVALAQASAAFIKQVKPVSEQTYFIALSPVGADQLIADLGKEIARGVQVAQVIPFPWSDRTKIAREYKQAIARYAKNAELSFYGLEGYINAKLVVTALERAAPTFTRDALTKALRSGPFDLGGYQVNFLPGSNAGSHYVEISVIGADGRIMN
jgi:ABC-type branched-subunit amino acid transport system substrate-binding protein